jgi:hypothetical protein
MKLNLKKGNFDDQLTTSIINNIKNKIYETENILIEQVIYGRFTSELDCKIKLGYVENLSKIKKKTSLLLLINI